MQKRKARSFLFHCLTALFPHRFLFSSSPHLLISSSIFFLIGIVYSASASVELRFTEVSKDVGLIWKHRATPLDPIDDMISWFGPGVAAGDYNRDGFLDLYVVGGLEQPNALFKNNGNGTFTEVTEKAGVGDTSPGRGAVFFDYDNNGWLDLYVTNHTKNMLYHNSGDETFTDVTEKAGVGDPSSSIGFAVGDYDNDGDLDLYVVNWHPHVTGALPSPNTLYRNNGNRTFTDVTKYAGVGDGGKGMSAIFFDYDNDGWQDLYVANDFGADVLYRNERDGTFSDVSDRSLGPKDRRFSESMGVCAGDYDNDGDLDLYVTDYLVDALWRNNDNGTFTNVAVEAGVNNNEVGWHASFVDFDLDGWRDLFVINGDVVVKERTNQDRLYRNNGLGRFEDIAAQAGLLDPFRGRGGACGDFDLDGDVDIVIARHNGKLAYYRNDSPPTGNWISLELSGQTSNRNGVGAKVYVTAKGRTQFAERLGNSGYAGQEAPQLIFGIGDAPQADVKVEWPASKIIQSWKDIAANQRLAIDEHGGLATNGIVAEALSKKKPITLGEVKRTALIQNYPNPFNSETWIPYQLSEEADISIQIYDVMGRVIRTFRLGRQSPGLYISKEKAAYWDGKSNIGEPVANGVYYYRMEADTFVDVKKMAIVK